LVHLGADIAAITDDGETPLQLSILMGHHQVAQVLRELERTARAQQAAAKERAQQAALRDIAAKRAAADRVAAEIMEAEEREEAAKVRVAPPSPPIRLHSVQLGGVRCGVSVMGERLPAHCMTCSGHGAHSPPRAYAAAAALCAAALCPSSCCQ
jgi:hypothetical protein